MSEEEYFEQLCSNSVDGTLTESEREKLEAHLAECSSCAALKRDLEQMRALFETETEFPEGLHDKIMERVRQEGRLRVVQPEKPARRLPALTMVAAAAVVLLVVLGGGAGSMFGMFSGMSTSGMSGAGASTAEALPKPEGELAQAVQDAAKERVAPSEGSADAAAGDTAAAVEPETPVEPRTAPEAQQPATYDAPAEANTPSQAPHTAETPAAPPTAPIGARPEAEAETASAAGHSVEEPNGKSADAALTLPAALNGVRVAHCYLAEGTGELPDIGGELLSTGEGASYFLLDSSMDTIQNTFKALEEAGFTVTAYDAPGLTLDSKAERWLLIAAEG